MRKYLVLFFCGILYAQKPSVELCAAFGRDDCGDCSDTYSIYIAEAKPIEEHPVWNLKDSVSCKCGSWAKPLYTLHGLPGTALPALSFSSCSHIGSNEKRTISMPRPPTVALETFVGKQVHFAKNLASRNEVEAFYGKKVEAYWKTSFVCQGDSLNNTTLNYRIDAVLVGECSKDFLKSVNRR